MKKITLLLLLIIGTASFAQVSVQEYNYLTSGFVIQISTGQDLNKGYRLDKLGKFSVGFTNEKKVDTKRTSEFFSVYNEGNSNPTNPIGLMVKMYREDNDKFTYFFMPGKGSSIDIYTKAIENYNANVFTSNEPQQQHSWNYLMMIASLISK